MHSCCGPGASILFLSASLPAGAQVNLVGTGANLTDGRAQFLQLGLNGSALRNVITFSLLLDGPGDAGATFSVSASPVDCHGPPTDLVLLAGGEPTARDST